MENNGPRQKTISEMAHMLKRISFWASVFDEISLTNGKQLEFDDWEGTCVQFSSASNLILAREERAHPIQERRKRETGSPDVRLMCKEWMRMSQFFPLFCCDTCVCIGMCSKNKERKGAFFGS